MNRKLLEISSTLVRVHNGLSTVLPKTKDQEGDYNEREPYYSQCELPMTSTCSIPTTWGHSSRLKLLYYIVFQKIFPTIRPNISQAIHYFGKHGFFPQRMKGLPVVLILMTDTPKESKNYRPTNLCNFY